MTDGEHTPFPQEFSELSGRQRFVWHDTYGNRFQSQIPFLYETAILQGLETWKPWEHPEQSIPEILNEWEEIKQELNRRFSNRENKDVPELMRKGISFFYEMLFWCNLRPAEIKNSTFSNLTVIPINVEERLKFILSRPGNYHSYVQLGELFIELHKLFSKQQVMKKASKP